MLAIGLLAAALNLRIGVAEVGPVLSDIRTDLGLSATAAGLLTTIPVVAFGAFAFLAPGLTRRVGMHRLLAATMLVLAGGILLRLIPAASALFGGTVLVGAAIAVANVVMPAAIKRDFSHRVGLMMGLYSTALFLGAALASGLTVPLAGISGGWRPALAWWATPAAGAFLLLVPPLIRARHSGIRIIDGESDADAGRAGLRSLLRNRAALSVTALMGLQSMSYYATLTWVPTMLQDAGLGAHDAGWQLSFSAFPAIAAALAAPALARRSRPTWLPIAVSALFLTTAFLGLAVAPTSAPYLWMTLLGIGQGSAISLSLSYIVWRSRDPHHAAQLSTLAQGIGYLFAGLGPIGLAALHTATGSWALPLAALIGLAVLQVLAGARASRAG